MADLSAGMIRQAKAAAAAQRTGATRCPVRQVRRREAAGSASHQPTPLPPQHAHDDRVVPLPLPQQSVPAPPLDDERAREVPEIELPDAPSMPASVNYSSMIDE